MLKQILRGCNWEMGEASERCGIDMKNNWPLTPALSPRAGRGRMRSRPESVRDNRLWNAILHQSSRDLMLFCANSWVAAALVAGSAVGPQGAALRFFQHYARPRRVARRLVRFARVASTATG